MHKKDIGNSDSDFFIQKDTKIRIDIIDIMA